MTLTFTTNLLTQSLTMSKLLTGELQIALNGAKYTRKTTKIQNNNPHIAKLITHLPAIAESMGIDFSRTGWTFKVMSPEDGLKKIYQPAVGTYQGKVCLQWGNTFTPLTELKGNVSYVLDGKKVIVVVEVGDEFYPFDAYIRKDTYVDDITLRKAVKAGRLETIIDDLKLIPDSMAGLKPNVEYLVTGYSVGSYNGKATYALMVKDEGLYSANSGIINRLVDEPVITEDKPARLVVGEVKEKTASGYPIVPIIHFSVYAETEIEEYTFD